MRNKNIQPHTDSFQEKIYLLQQSFYLLLIFFLPTQLGKHFWPSFSIVSGLRIDYLSPTLYVTDLLIAALFVLTLIRFLADNKRIIPQFRIRSPLLFGIICLWIAVVLAGVIIANRPLLAGYGLLKLLECLFFIGMTIYLIKQHYFFKRVLYWYAFGMLFQSTLAITQFYAQGSLGGIFYFFGERTFTGQTPGIANASLNGTLILRPYGTLPHPNVLAGYLLIGVILLVSHSNYFTAVRQKIFFYTIEIIGVIAIILSMSRSAVLLGTSLIVYSFIRKGVNILTTNGKPAIQKRKQQTPDLLQRILVLGIIAAVVSVIIFLTTPIIPRYFSFDTTGEAYQQRESLARAAVEMVRQNPLIGAGLQQFLVQLPMYIRYQFATTPLQPVHNIFLLITAETGLIGLLCLFCFLLFAFYFIKKNNNGIRHAGLLLFSILFLGMTDHYFLTLQQGRLLASLVIGLSLVSFITPFVFKRGKNNRNPFF